jgi:hypothetical protein
VFVVVPVVVAAGVVIFDAADELVDVEVGRSVAMWLIWISGARMTKLEIVCVAYVDPVVTAVIVAGTV